MTSDLVQWVDRRLAESDLDEAAGILVLAAMEGDEQLDDYLGSTGASSRKGPTATPATATTSSGIYLRQLEVEGFRGIGKRTTLAFPPGPGLTIIAGRNGSGKSSIAEALEVALTGETYRFRRKSAVSWGKSWRNLHHPRALIKVSLHDETRGAIGVQARWSDETDALEERTTEAHHRVGGQWEALPGGFAGLGWGRPLEQYRPMLSYDELGGILEDAPSKLHDALASILGIGQIADAHTRLQQRYNDRSRPAKDVRARRLALQKEAAAVNDERAADIAVRLKKAAPDTAAIRAVVTGSTTVPAAEVNALRTLASIDDPVTVGVVEAVAARVAAAVGAVADSAVRVVQRQRLELSVLNAALQLHDEHGDMPCPLCQQGTLDSAWAASAVSTVESLTGESAELSANEKTLADARRELDGLFTSPPAALASPFAETDTVVAAHEAWTAWANAPAGSDHAALLARAAHAVDRIGPLVTALTELRTVAAAERDRLDEIWQPLAARVAAWCDAADEVASTKAAVDRLRTAATWLKDNMDALKQERIAPIEDGAKRYWGRLRQESDVEIGRLALVGSNTTRKVQISASVDGTPAGDITVLSQGELHALALALFIPRATLPASPFRFLILDDPVQAMDPSKIDGLVELLSELAKERQVIVFSHDDRLAAAVRRSAVDAHVLAVVREKDSQVGVETLQDPVERYLRDARSLFTSAKYDALQDEALRRTLPGMLRFAVEAAAKDRHYRRCFDSGATLADTERVWQETKTTRQRVALAVFGDAEAESGMNAWADKPGRRSRRDALRTVGPAMHRGLDPSLDPRTITDAVAALIEDIKASA